MAQHDIIIKNIPYEDNCGDSEAALLLLTTNPSRYMNVLLRRDGKTKDIVTFHVDAIKKLRDELMRVYPIAVLKQATPATDAERAKAVRDTWSAFEVALKAAREAGLSVIPEYDGFYLFSRGQHLTFNIERSTKL